MRYYRPTWAEIDLGNLAHNFRLVRKTVGEEAGIMATVKADAYGHGLIPVAKRLVSCGADFFGVASIDEGIALRKAGIRLPVLVLGLIMKKDCHTALKYNLTLTVCDLELAKALNNCAGRLGRKADLHVKVDTGMGRIGILHQDAEALVKKMHRLKHANIEGIFTHFPFADINRGFTHYQIFLFHRLIHRLKRAGIDIPLVHAANSIGILDYKKSHFNMVRPGLILYGLSPKVGLKADLRPVLSLKTRVIFAKKMAKGFGISYGHDYVTRQDTRIVTLPIGYGDGYPRNLSNIAPVLISGKRFKIAGRICMDQIMVDVGKLTVKAGDEAVLIGTQARGKITAEELASLSSTIPYEIVCGLGSRIPRVYV